MEFGVLASIVRMAHKYQVDAILEEALRRLKTVFTSDFDTWEQHQGMSTAIVTLSTEDALEAVNLSLLTGRTEMLASAFYMCAQLDVQTLFKGVTRADGTLEQLSTYDLQRCLTGTMLLLKHDAYITTIILRADALEDCTCGSPEARHEILDRELGTVLSQLPLGVETNPIHSDFLTDKIDELHRFGGLCSGCATAMQAHHTKLRRDLWGQLTRFFQLAA